MSSLVSTTPIPYHRTEYFVNGKYSMPIGNDRDVDEQVTYPIHNHHNGEVLTHIANCDDSDITLAITSAQFAITNDWGNYTGKQRGDILHAFTKIFTQRRNDIIELECWNTGRKRQEIERDFSSCHLVGFCHRYARIAEELDRNKEIPLTNTFHYDNNDSDTTEDTVVDSKDYTTVLRWEPVILGVILSETVAHEPFLAGIRHIIRAIATGACIILTPPSMTPLSCLLLGEMFNEAGLPSGVLNILTGEDIRLDDHTGTVKIAYDYSPPVLSHEGGTYYRHAPMIVFNDIDTSHIDTVVDWIITGFLYGSGQMSTSMSRLLIQKGHDDDTTLKQQILQRLKQRLHDVYVGPVSSQNQYSYLFDMMTKGELDEDLPVLIGGIHAQQQYEITHGRNGYTIVPTVFIDVPTSSELWMTEIGGPILCITDFDSDEMAIEVSDAISLHSTCCAIFTSNRVRSEYMTRRLHSEIVWVNSCEHSFSYQYISLLGQYLYDIADYVFVKRIISCELGVRTLCA